MICTPNTECPVLGVHINILQQSLLLLAFVNYIDNVLTKDENLHILIFKGGVLCGNYKFEYPDR